MESVSGGELPPLEIEPASGAWQRQRLRLALARIEPSEGMTLPGLLTAELPRLLRSLVLMVITPKLDLALAAALEGLRQSGFEVAVVWIAGSAEAAAALPPAPMPLGVPLYRWLAETIWDVWGAKPYEKDAVSRVATAVAELAGGPCASHPQRSAELSCDGCDELLCRDCVRVTASLLICRRCGERAFELRQEAAVARVEATVSRRATAADSEGFGWFSHHVVVPAAIIAMVVALLFYLLDLRSVFLNGGRALKQVGLCFAVATVLIARCGKAGGDADRQQVYSLALLCAMGLVMMVSPWSPASRGGWEMLINLAIIIAIWRFASRITRQMSIEDDPSPPSGKRLYGVERLQTEARKRAQQPTRHLSPQRRRPPGRFARRRRAAAATADAHGNPTAGVARLALMALAAFALGEPLLLRAPPEIGERALAAVIIFLLATGVVLAAGSGLGLARQALRFGAPPSAALVPSRIGLAAVLTVIMLAVMLAFPGVTFRGSGVAPGQADDGSPLTVGRGQPDGTGRARSGGSPRRSGDIASADSSAGASADSST